MLGQVRALIVAATLGATAAAASPARVEETQFVVVLSGPAESGVGKPAAFEVKVTARGGYHLNPDYPSNFKAADGGEVRYPAPRVDQFTREPCADAPADSCAASATIPFVADRAGEHRVGGTLAFCVCNADECRIEKIAVARPVLVK